MTSNHHAPYDLGYTRATMADTKRSEAVTLSKAQKFRLSSDCSLRLHEAGIASNRESERRGEYVPGSCTHRPSHHGSWKCPKYVTQPSGESVLRQVW